MNWSIDIAPLIPLPLVIGLGLCGLVLVALILFVRNRGGILRLLALALLVAAALNPSIRKEDREPLNDIAVLIVDRSQSQSMGKRGERTSAAAAHIEREVRGLANTELRVATVKSGLTAGDDGTQAFRALKDALADVPPERYAGAILITDGQVHDVPDSPSDIGYEGPVHALITGERNERDRRVALIAAPRFGIVGQRQTIRFVVKETGSDASGKPVRVRISVDGGEPREMKVLPNREVQTEIAIDHGGNNLTEIIADPMPGELTEHNNRAVIVTQGVRDRLRVLLISGEPHPGERTWRNLLKADAAVDLVHFTILRPPEKQDGTPIRELSLIAFPTRELFVEKLREFDLVIFDRYRRRGVLPMSYMANIANYVEDGGAVLVAAGPEYAKPLSIFRTPLADILPAAPTGHITERPYRALVTDLGTRHPVTRDLPGHHRKGAKWGKWFRLVDADAQRGDAVMSGPGGKPLMLLARTRKGRVAQLLSDHAWLWARGYDGGGPQAELLRRMAHWLMKEPELEEEALSARQDGSKLVIERRTMAEKTPPVTVTTPSGKTETITLSQYKPGIWRGAKEISEAGIHRLDDGSLKAFAAVGSADPRETAEIHATGDKLRPITRASGGGIAWLAAAGAPNGRLQLPRLVKIDPDRAMAGSGWLGLKANRAYRVRAIEELPLFSTLVALAALLMLLSAMWYREGR